MAERLDFTVETIELDLAPLAGALSRRLRDAGLPATPGRSAAFASALTLVRPVARRRLYWTARTIFVTDPSQVAAFDAVFAEVFGHGPGGLLEPSDVRTVSGAPETSGPSEDAPRSAGGSDERDPRSLTWTAPAADGSAEGEAEEMEVPLAIASDAERLGTTSFDALAPEELAQLYRLMARLELATPRRRTRRYERARHGEQVDLRRTLRASLRTAGDPIRLARRRRRVVPRRLVMLCDISGSMEPYARAYLQLLASAAGSGRRAEAFVFATRLTRVTRALAARRPDRAIQRAAAAAPDWASGTRIGEALRTFNDRHGRRGMARGAVVVVLSDGWERGDPALVAREMARLSRLAHRIVWVNPRAAATGFSVRAGGMVAALPYVDALVSGHSFAALAEVADAIGADTWDRDAALARFAADAAPEADEPEPWASATPVPGSSVAMPSGTGARRGHTTPGWGPDDR